MSQDNAFSELIQDYVVECLPLAERVAELMVELEQHWRDGEPEEESVAYLKGTLHTIKGNSAMMGLTPMQAIAHALEDLCALAGAAPRFRHEETAAWMVEGSGLLVDQIRHAKSGGDAAQADEFVARVRAFLQNAALSAEVRSSVRARSVAQSLGATRAVESASDTAIGTIRVDFRRLDSLLEIFGEAMIQQSALATAYRRLLARVGSGSEIDDLDRTILSLQETLKRLEAAVIDARLLPISTVFGRFTRLVREIAHTEGKRVRLVTEGGNTRLDKTIIDRLGEPLVHLLSNAVAHGIETPEGRKQAGKPIEATLRLSAAALSDRIIITMSDDGRGLDAGKILAKAQALGLEARLADPEQLYSLIFLPGFSTAERVSTLSGRGVGLEVVATSIHTLGGTVQVDSRSGKGVSFTLSLPLTLAIVKSLIVEVDRERYALPLNQVAETVRVAPSAIHEINRRGVTLWRGDVIHVSDGGALLGTQPTETGPRNYYVVIFSGLRRRGVLVDRLIGHQDVVVKGLDPTLGKPDVVSGATILGDGRVACILDVVRIVEQK